MPEVDLTGWLNSPGTKMLVSYLRQRQAAVVRNFLANSPVDPAAQGKTAGFHEIEQLLTSGPDNVRKTVETALREQKAK